jgi:hypothetical protein
VAFGPFRRKIISQFYSIPFLRKPKPNRRSLRLAANVGEISRLVGSGGAWGVLHEWVRAIRMNINIPSLWAHWGIIISMLIFAQGLIFYSLLWLHTKRVNTQNTN